jgi:oligoendopeptidase F
MTGSGPLIETAPDELPRWSVADLHESLESRSFTDALERVGAGVRAGYDDLLSRAGMDTAEQLGRSFGLDVTDESFWNASLDVIRARITDYDRLAQAT